MVLKRVDATLAETIGLGQREEEEWELRGVGATTDWVLLSGPETQSGKVNHYLCLTPHTHTHKRAHTHTHTHKRGHYYT